MAAFPDFSNLSSPNIGNVLDLPNATYPYYWAWILAGIWIITTLSLYFTEKERLGKGKMLSSMAVAAFAVLVLGVVGTIIGFISLDIMIYILVIFIVLMGVWFYSK